MIAKLIKKNNRYVCSECLMRQPYLRESCNFCEAIFSNYEEIITNDWVIKNEDKIYEVNEQNDC